MPRPQLPMLNARVAMRLSQHVRFMKQGKLEVVKQEMVRVNIDTLAISEVKWTGIGEFNSDDHYIYYCGQESLRRKGVAIIATRESEM